ncbi:hypothetical protein [Persicobacter diffluens]|uniref:Outer membrane beta barrel protein n=1 Tax=Persicobacter diffluens TaxID=981 RepID=A0AAN4W3Z9_9BACT|nr:outer membrane beta barrel protein [Persicobacter diffluens]
MNFKSLPFLFLFLLTTILSFAQDKPELHVGGALRFNYNYSNWKTDHQKKGGEFGMDVFRLNAKASYKGIRLDAEYRFYSSAFGGAMLKQGWLAYDLSEVNEIQLGLTQVPFGNTTYNSNNWFFSINYYVGLEDDHDMGFKYSHKGEKWEYDIAFFKNAEELTFGDGTDLDNSRYAYDVSSIDLGNGLQYRNKEANTFNGKLSYNIEGSESKHKIGGSVQYGGIYNLDTEEMGDHYAVALHYMMDWKRFNFKAQASHYNYNTAGPDTDSKDLIAMGAYGAPYLVAAEASLYTAGIAYTQPVAWGPVSSLMFYNDFGWMNKTVEDFADAYQNVTGVLVTAGSVFTYIDLAAGKNQPWLGPDWTDGLGAGNPDADWTFRFNINVGYYF